MKKRIILVFLVLLFAMGIAFGENNTTDTAEIDDNADYILPISITNEGIKFDDGFIGFCIDSGKGSISTSDKFTLGVLGDGEAENNIKLAIIECYKQGKEDAMADILSHIEDKDSNNDVLKAAFDSSEKIGDTAVVDIDNSTEATFEFEHLNSVDESKSDCIAYKVSMKTVESKSPDNISDDANNQTEENEVLGAANDEGNNNQTEDNATLGAANNNETESSQAPLKAKEPTENTTAKKTDNDNRTSENPNNDTNTTETNKTIINKTNTVIVNENNTTIINHNNVKTVNDTNGTPQNDTVQDLLKAGNPILILIIVVAVIAVVAVAMRRKD